ncbi:HD domain-containing protein [bacterium]|nr:HD domain-containing protein [bacterium]
MQSQLEALSKSLYQIFPADIASQIQSKGELYLVGGALRDFLLLGYFPNPELDFLVTGVTQDDLLAILRTRGTARYVGRSFPVIKFHTRDAPAIFHDFARPTLHRNFELYDQPLPEVSLEEDLSSRDFTINAMAFHLQTKTLIDPHQGVNDISGQTIRLTAAEALKNDPLRILRALRLAAQLKFNIDAQTYKLISQQAGLIGEVSVERVREEFIKLLTRASLPGIAFIQMQEVGLLKMLLPELEQCVGITQPGGRHLHDVFYHSLKTVDFAPPDLVIRLAALFHDVGKPARKFIPEDGRARFYGHQQLSENMARKRLNILKFPKNTITQVVTLIRNHMFTHKVTPKGIRRLISRVGEDLIPMLFQLRYADMKAQDPRLSLKEDQEFEEKVNKVIFSKPPLTVTDLDINGYQIMDTFGLPQGKLIGQIYKHLLDKVLEDPENNKRDKLLEYVKIFLDSFREND